MHMLSRVMSTQHQGSDDDHQHNRGDSQTFDPARRFITLFVLHNVFSFLCSHYALFPTRSIIRLSILFTSEHHRHIVQKTLHTASKEMPMDKRIQRTRELLQKALIELINERGYDAITVQDIVEKANLGRTTFYLHYSSKDELFMSCHELMVG